MRLISKKELAKMLGITQAGVDWHRGHDSLFPKGYRLGKTLRWKASDFREEQEITYAKFTRTTLCDFFGVTHSTLRTIEQVQGFPKPTGKIGKCVTFSVEDIYKFVEQARIV